MEFGAGGGGTMRAAEFNRTSREFLGRQAKIMTAVPRAEWADRVKDATMPPIAVFRSRRFLAQLFAPLEGGQRLTISRTTLNGRGDWVEGITWDELQRVKRECGFGDRCAVEFYPPDAEVVNVANMRHLFLLDAPLSCMWTRGRAP